MKYRQNYIQQGIAVILGTCFLVASTIFPASTFAQDIELSPSIQDLSTAFSKNFCMEISQGISPENASENAARDMIKGIIFSPIVKELMDVPKEYLTTLITNNI